jgi:ABC-type antimicrobial peptide transport system permease subunit
MEGINLMSISVRLPRICALTDGTTTIVAACVFCYLNGKTPSEIISQNIGMVLFLVFPASLIAAWLGYVHTVQLLDGNKSWVRPLVEGFVVGAVPWPLFSVIGMLQEAIAAGPAWPTIGFSPLSEWVQYFGFLFVASVVAGAIGALYAAFLSAINRAIIHVSS